MVVNHNVTLNGKLLPYPLWPCRQTLFLVLILCVIVLLREKTPAKCREKLVYIRKGQRMYLKMD